MVGPITMIFGMEVFLIADFYAYILSRFPVVSNLLANCPESMLANLLLAVDQNER